MIILDLPCGHLTQKCKQMCVIVCMHVWVDVVKDVPPHFKQQQKMIPKHVFLIDHIN